MPNQNHSVGEAVALDLGGTWIKGGAGRSETLLPSLDSIRAHRWPNPLAVVRTAEEYAEVIVSCCRELAGGKKIASVAISTAGEVAPSGRAYRTAAHHLAALTLSGWLDLAEEKLGCQISLINDAEAFLLGVAASGRLPARGQVAGVAVGTGLGFCVVRDGRWWKPGRRLNLLGSILVPDGNYDTWSSAVRAAHASGGDLHALLSGKNGVASRDAYLSGLARILASAATLFQLDRIFLGGGLSEAAAGVPLAAELMALLPPLLLPGQATPEIEIVEKGNLEVLRGTLALAAGLATGNDIAFEGSFGTLATEQAGQTLRIEENPPEEIARLLAESESEAANRFLSSAPLLGTQASILRSKLLAGGRAIYVGAAKCGECHTKAYAIWKNTPHAHAFESLDPSFQRKGFERLQGVNKTFDPECIACHVTGWDPEEYLRYESGFVNEEFAADDAEKLLQGLLAGNQCENCHGPGNRHVEYIEADNKVAAINEVKVTLLQAEQTCNKCHDGDNSPGFKFEKYWEDVKHYGTD